jgi:hypothetical protein
MEKFIEYLEEIVDLKRSCSIRFKTENGGVAIIQTKLSDINTDIEESYIKTADGLKINVSQLIEVNGRAAQNIC